jgi:hypothetical protein
MSVGIDQQQARCAPSRKGLATVFFHWPTKQGDIHEWHGTDRLFPKCFVVMKGR